MYAEIGAFDAKAKLSALLRAVAQGQRYTIMLRGRPIADLIPSESAVRQNVQTAIEAMRTIPKVRGISADTIRDWVDEGRR